MTDAGCLKRINMREIKFRAWNDCANLMEDIYSLTWFGEHGVKSANHPDYTIMQYTGIKDMHGKEVYEGDIVQNFDDDMYTIQWTNTHNSAYFAAYALNDQTLETEMEFFCGEIEVIGNIYENPELLNTQTITDGEQLKSIANDAWKRASKADE